MESRQKPSSAVKDRVQTVVIRSSGRDAERSVPIPPGGSLVPGAEVGGRYRIVVRAQSGEEHDVSGTFREVVPNRRLVFTWAWRTTPDRESLVTVELKPDGDGTLLTLTHEQFFDEAARDRHQSGWSPILDRLSEVL